MTREVEFAVAKKLDYELHRIADALEERNKLIRQLLEKDKKPVEKSCENCMYDPNNKKDEVCFCNHCFDYSEWEGL